MEISSRPRSIVKGGSTMGNLDVGPTLSLAVAGRRSRGVATLKLS
jgi:hypothetical protein